MSDKKQEEQTIMGLLFGNLFCDGAAKEWFGVDLGLPGSILDLSSLFGIEEKKEEENGNDKF